MTSKHVIIVLISIVAFIAGKVAWDFLFDEPEIASFEDSDWGRKNYLGVRFESPFELSETDIELPAYIKPYVKTMNTFKYDSKSISMFIGLAEYNEGIKTDLDGAVDGAVQNMKANKDITDFTYQVEPINKNLLNGRLVKGKCKINKKDAEIVAELYKKDLKLLQIFCINLSYEENRVIKERIMKSLRVTL